MLTVMIGEIKGLFGWMTRVNLPNEVTFKPRVEGHEEVKWIGASYLFCVLSFLICKVGCQEKSNSKLANTCEALRTVLGPECGCFLHHLYHNHQSFIYSVFKHLPSVRYFSILWWESEMENIKSFQELNICL